MQARHFMQRLYIESPISTSFYIRYQSEGYAIRLLGRVLWKKDVNRALECCVDNTEKRLHVPPNQLGHSSAKKSSFQNV